MLIRKLAQLMYYVQGKNEDVNNVYTLGISRREAGIMDLCPESLCKPLFYGQITTVPY